MKEKAAHKAYCFPCSLVKVSLEEVSIPIPIEGHIVGNIHVRLQLIEVLALSADLLLELVQPVQPTLVASSTSR